MQSITGLQTDSPAYIQDTDYINSVPADDLAPNGARPSAGTQLTTETDMIFKNVFS